MNPCMDKQYLEKKYLEEGLSTVGIAHIAGVYPSTVLRWLRRFKIPVREPKKKGRKYTDIQKVREALEILLEDDFIMSDEDIEDFMAKAEEGALRYME